MGGLSMNPNNPDVETAPKLAHQIAEKEEWDLPQNPSDSEPTVKEKEPAKMMKFGSFEINTTYPRTIPGFVRICQVLLLIVAFLCLIINPAWPDQGIFAFFCVFLVFGAFISGYLFFTVVADLRGSTLFGITWRLLELVYFGAFGLIIFLGSCLAANKSEGKAGLTASAVFGFGSVITFVYYFWTTWKQKGSGDEDNKEEEDQKDAKPEGEEQEIIENLPDVETRNEFSIERGDSIRRSRRHSLNIERKNNSLPFPFKDKLYENQPEFNVKAHRRRFSAASDKDSAYSEGTITPTKTKVIPPKMRRTASAFDIARDDYDHVLQKQPLAHLSHRPYGANFDNGRTTSHGNNVRTGYGYPDELGNLNIGYCRNGSRFEEDDLHRSIKRRKSMPDWLKAALGTDAGRDDNMIEEDSEIAMPPMQRTATLPTFSPREFPLLNTSDEESINYPSISQNGFNNSRQFCTLPARDHRHSRKNNGGVRTRYHHGNSGHHQHHHHHHRGRKMGNHHGRRHFRHRMNHHHHHHHHRQRGHHQSDGGRRPINKAHDDYLRQMMGNDELVIKEGFQKEMREFQPQLEKSNEAGKRTMVLENPNSIHFPEQSRWDDEYPHPDNILMEKYFADAQKMRSRNEF